jgi:glycosyltransferase involved in cell wall biosynthesis
MNCFDGAKYLRGAIDSVINQTYENWELIFWDNQSKDGSVSIAKSYNDSRIKYFRAESHTLLYEARNQAFARCQGELIAFLDVDDWWLPNKLESQIPFFEDIEIGFSCTNFWIFNENSNKTTIAYKAVKPSGRVLSDLLNSYSVGLLTLLVRRSALPDEAEPFNPRFHIIGDFDLVIRLAATWKLARTNTPLATYRTHGANESLKHPDLMISEVGYWINTYQTNPIIGKSRNFEMVAANMNYNVGIGALRNRNRSKAISAFRNINVNKIKFRLIIAILLPFGLLDKINS